MPHLNWQLKALAVSFFPHQFPVNWNIEVRRLRPGPAHGNLDTAEPDQRASASGGRRSRRRSPRRRGRHSRRRERGQRQPSPVSLPAAEAVMSKAYAFQVLCVSPSHERPGLWPLHFDGVQRRVDVLQVVVRSGRLPACACTPASGPAVGILP